jgi:Flp pilus assembly protein TadD
VAALPTSAEAHAILAGSKLYCNDAAGAVLAAREALGTQQRADAAYYLGAALAASGDRSGARAALIAACDTAPASEWRERAERALGDL